MTPQRDEPRFFLNSYHPLIRTAYGRRASEKHGIPPFVDGSIRREPDLEHQWPTISCLCRGRMFAPRLRCGDVVAYITVKNVERDRQRLTAILRVKEVFETHADAAAWFRRQNVPLPSNCMVKGNPPLPLTKSLRDPCRPMSGGCPTRHGWDAGYTARAKSNGRFVVCDPLFVNLTWGAPLVRIKDLKDAFGRDPGTRTPPKLPIEGFRRLVRHLKIPRVLAKL